MLWPTDFVWVVVAKILSEGIIINFNIWIADILEESLRCWRFPRLNGRFEIYLILDEYRIKAFLLNWAFPHLSNPFSAITFHDRMYDVCIAKRLFSVCVALPFWYIIFYALFAHRRTGTQSWATNLAWIWKKIDFLSEFASGSVSSSLAGGGAAALLLH